jgi:hypothetical protein
MVTIVQQAAGEAFTGTQSFDDEVAEGNSVIIVAGGFSFSGTNPTFSGPQLGGAPVPNAVELGYQSGVFDDPSNPDGANNPAWAAAAVWLLPDVPGGRDKEVTLDASENLASLIIYEVRDLGRAPLLDVSSAGNGQDGSPTSGPSGNTTADGDLIIGVTVALESVVTDGPASPWTAVQNGTGEISGGYQLAGGAGSSYTYATTNQFEHAWAALVIALTPADPVPGSDIALRSAGTVAMSGTPEYGDPTVAGDLGISLAFAGSGNGSTPFAVSEGYTVIPAGGGFEWAGIAYKQGLAAGEDPPVWTIEGEGTPEATILLTFSGAAAGGGPAGSADGGTGGAEDQVASVAALLAGALVVFACGWYGGATAPSIVNGITDSAGRPVDVTSYNNAGGDTFLYDFCWGVTGAAAGQAAETAEGLLSAFSNGGCGIAVFAPAPQAAPAGLLMAGVV